MASFNERFSELLESKPGSSSDIAAALGVSKQTISAWKLGTRSPKRPTVQTIASFFHVSIPWLMGITDEKDDPRASQGIESSTIPGIDTLPYVHPNVMVPIIGVVRCGENGLALEEFDEYEGADVKNPNDYFWLRCTGDSMEPRIYEGDLVLIHKQQDVDSGDLAVVVVDGEEGTLKKIIKEANMVILEPLNHNHPTRYFVGDDCSKLLIAGKVVMLERKF